jgi:hypothetical protein
MAFDPDKFLKETKPVTGEGSFDPDKFLSQTTPNQDSPYSANEEYNNFENSRKAIAPGVAQGAALPYQIMTAPVNQAIVALSNLVQGNPQEPLPSLAHPLDYLNKYGSTKSVLGTLPFGNEPIYKGISPNDIASGVADIGAGSMMTEPLIDKASQSIQNSLTKGAEANRVKTLARTSNLPPDVSAETLANGKYSGTVETLNKYGVANQISDPVKLNQTLNGSKINTFDTNGNRVQINNPTNPGLINTVGREVDAHVKDLSSQLKPIKTQDIIDSIHNEIANSSDNPNSLMPFDEKADAALGEKLNKMFQPERYPTKTIEDLVEMKRNAADLIYKIKKNPEQYAVKGITDITPYKGVWNFVDNHINSLADGSIPGAADLVTKNNDLSDMYRTRDIVSNAPLGNVTSPSVPEALVSQGVGKAVGHPMMGARPAMGLIHQQLSVLPARVANVQEAISGAMGAMNQLPNIQSSAMAAQYPQDQSPQPTQVNQQGRFPQSVGLNTKVNLPMQLTSYQIPRDSKDILANSHVVIAKIAQMAGDDPGGVVQMFKDAIENHPELLPKVLPALVKIHPELFAQDDYDRVDKKILDRQLKQKALKDIQNDPTMDIRTKALKAKRLTEESILD